MTLALLAIAVAVTVWLAFRVRLRTQASVLAPEASDDGAITALAPASIVTEALHASQADDLLRSGIRLEADSHVATRIAEIAGPALKSALEGAPAVMQRGRFLVEFSSEGSRDLASGTVSLLRRVDGRLQPTLVGKAAKFDENAVVVGRTGQKAAKALAVSHVVVLLAVQAQLVTMERQLERIEKKLDALRKLLDDTQLARVRGRLRKLGALRDEMSMSSWSDADVQRWLVFLDACDAEFFEVEELAKAQCSDATTKIQNQKMQAEFLGRSGEGVFKELQDEVDRYRQYYELYSLTVLGRVVIEHIKEAVGRSPSTTQLKRDIDGLIASAEAHKALLEQQAPKFRTIFRRKSHENKRRMAIVDGAAEFRARADDLLGRIQTGFNVLDSRKRARVIVEVDERGGVQPLAVLTDDPRS